jgi:hypothetical protein
MQNNSSTSSRCFSRFPVAWSWQELCANKSLRQQHFDVYLTPVLDLNTLILEYAAPQLGDYKGLAKMHFPGNSLCGDCQQRVVQLAGLKRWPKLRRTVLFCAGSKHKENNFGVCYKQKFGVYPPGLLHTPRNLRVQCGTQESCGYSRSSREMIYPKQSICPERVIANESCEKEETLTFLCQRHYNAVEKKWSRDQYDFSHGAVLFQRDLRKYTIIAQKNKPITSHYHRRRTVRVYTKAPVFLIKQYDQQLASVWVKMYSARNNAQNNNNNNNTASSNPRNTILEMRD